MKKATAKKFWNSVFCSIFGLSQPQFIVRYIRSAAGMKNETEYGPMPYWKGRRKQSQICRMGGWAETFLRKEAKDVEN